ncbi:uncharacterized protein LY79DRAFT_689477 [Colletotrichum navitas]|uniref:Uncharacterized protein n=1 Tax=Colletotrichum navitas TaxID=681940 RepID=A0AAD8PWB6_9PEZI|nr:uncharacterized protein LY79DRAFT_689477 [Colletotrichum navitas]KAK1585887.1 hypothetical protein LY79DRAFT_689477 [Colletotrichum navitas]
MIRNLVGMHDVQNSATGGVVDGGLLAVGDTSPINNGALHSYQLRSLQKLVHEFPERELGFLPRVMILGHECSFVARVPGPAKQSILYTRQQKRTTEIEIDRSTKVLGAL